MHCKSSTENSTNIKCSMLNNQRYNSIAQRYLSGLDSRKTSCQKRGRVPNAIFPKSQQELVRYKNVFRGINPRADAVASIYWLIFSLATWVASAFLVVKKVLTQPRVSLLTTRAVATAALP